MRGPDLSPPREATRRDVSIAISFASRTGPSAVTRRRSSARTRASSSLKANGWSGSVTPAIQAATRSSAASRAVRMRTGTGRRPCAGRREIRGRPGRGGANRAASGRSRSAPGPRAPPRRSVRRSTAKPASSRPRLKLAASFASSSTAHQQARGGGHRGPRRWRSGFFPGCQNRTTPTDRAADMVQITSESRPAAIRAPAQTASRLIQAYAGTPARSDP